MRATCNNSKRSYSLTLVNECMHAVLLRTVAPVLTRNTTYKNHLSAKKSQKNGVLLGKLIRCTECWKDGGPNYNPSNSHAKHLQCDFNKRNHTARLYKNTQTEYTTKVYLGRRPRELLPSKYKVYLVQEYRQKDEKCRCQSRRGNKSGPKDKAQRMGAPRPSLT